MKKAEALTHWRGMEPSKNPLALMQPIPYKTEGSKYGCSGIRIDGSPEFIDAVLSNLKSLIDGENNVTRLELARHKVEPRPGYSAGVNADSNAEVCYIRLHMRSAQGSAVSAFFDRNLHAASERYADTIGA